MQCNAKHMNRCLKFNANQMWTSGLRIELYFHWAVKRCAHIRTDWPKCQFVRVREYQGVGWCFCCQIHTKTCCHKCIQQILNFAESTYQKLSYCKFIATCLMSSRGRNKSASAYYIDDRKLAAFVCEDADDRCWCFAFLAIRISMGNVYWFSDSSQIQKVPAISA